MEFLL